MSSFSVTRTICPAISILFFLAACATAPQSPPSGLSGMGGTADPAEVHENALPGGSGTPLAVPARESSGNKTLDGTVLRYLQGGSPDSIRRAVERVNDDSRGMTDQNRVALAVAGEMVRILYPLEVVSWPMPSVPDSDPYMRIIKTARMGAYDTASRG